MVVYLDGGARESAPIAEEQLDVLAEATGVVVANRPSVAEGLEDRVGLQHSLLYRAELVTITSCVSQYGQILEAFSRELVKPERVANVGTRCLVVFLKFIVVGYVVIQNNYAVLPEIRGGSSCKIYFQEMGDTLGVLGRNALNQCAV